MTNVTFKPRRGRPRQERPGILTQEQAEALMSPEQIAERQARREAALKGKETRQRKALDAERAKEQEKMEQAASFPEYWNLQRATLTGDELARLESREEDVLDIEYLMRAFIDGTYQTPRDASEHVTLTEMIAAVKEEVAHGVTESIILVVDRLWTADERDLRGRILQKGGPTTDLLRYGFRTGLDGELVEVFRDKFMTKRVQLAPTNGVLICACGSQISTHISVVQAYARLRVPYICQRCREVAAPSVEHTKETRSPESTIFDQWGRVKDR